MGEARPKRVPKRQRSNSGFPTEVPLDVKAGPSDTEQAFDWPEEIPLRAMTVGDGEDEVRQSKMMAMIRGTDLADTSDYSGYECPHESTRLGLQGVGNILKIPEHTHFAMFAGL